MYGSQSEAINAANDIIDELRSRDDVRRDGQRHAELFRVRMEEMIQDDNASEYTIPTRHAEVAAIGVALSSFRNDEVDHPMIALAQVVVDNGDASEAAWAALKGFVL